MLPLSETRPHNYKSGYSMQRQEGQGEDYWEGLTAKASLSLQRLWDLQRPAERAMPHAVTTFDSNISFFERFKRIWSLTKKSVKTRFFFDFSLYIRASSALIFQHPFIEIILSLVPLLDTSVSYIQSHFLWDLTLECGRCRGEHFRF